MAKSFRNDLRIVAECEQSGGRCVPQVIVSCPGVGGHHPKVHWGLEVSDASTAEVHSGVQGRGGAVGAGAGRDAGVIPES